MRTIIAVIIGVVLVVVAAAGQNRPDVSARGRTDARGKFQILVDKGLGTAAVSYYQTISKPAHLNWKIDDSTLPDLLAYMGWGKLPVKVLSTGSPDELEKGNVNDEAVALRYFAPKTSSAHSAATELGWRKLVRLRVDASSNAGRAGITIAFLLLNYLQDPAAIGTDAFHAAPDNTQVLLMRGKSSPSTFPGYFLVYDEKEKITTHIWASFHGGDTARTGGKQFFVPAACGQCHGGDRRHAAPNLLDVEHWVERTGANDDFSIVKTPLPDAGPNLVNLATFIAKVKRLNDEIEGHNALAKTQPFVQDGIKWWNSSHAAGDTLVPVLGRSYGTKKWSGPEEDELLRLMNRYCYRCHATVKFNVFDKASVLNVRGKIVARLMAGDMPQDRALDTATRDRILTLLANAQ